MLDGKVTFPLREIYQHHNRNIQGIASWLKPDNNACDCPPPLTTKDKEKDNKGLAEQIFEDTDDSAGHPGAGQDADEDAGVKIEEILGPRG